MMVGFAQQVESESWFLVPNKLTNINMKRKLLDKISTFLGTATKLTLGLVFVQVGQYLYFELYPPFVYV